MDRSQNGNQKKFRLDVGSDSAGQDTLAKRAEEELPTTPRNIAETSRGVFRQREVRLLGSQQPHEPRVVAEKSHPVGGQGQEPIERWKGRIGKRRIDLLDAVAYGLVQNLIEREAK